MPRRHLQSTDGLHELLMPRARAGAQRDGQRASYVALRRERDVPAQGVPASAGRSQRPFQSCSSTAQRSRELAQLLTVERLHRAQDRAPWTAWSGRRPAPVDSNRASARLAERRTPASRDTNDSNRRASRVLHTADIWRAVRLARRVRSAAPPLKSGGMGRSLAENLARETYRSAVVVLIVDPPGGVA
jgi:hypothetical protein